MKAKITLPDGTVIELEGTREELEPNIPKAQPIISWPVIQPLPYQPSLPPPCMPDYVQPTIKW